jgi:hypothetical protein
MAVAVAVAVLAGVGFGIAAGLGAFNGRLGAFNGLSAAQHARIGANVLPPAVLAAIKRGNAGGKERVLQDTARLLGKTPDATFYVLTDTGGHLCYYDVLGLMSFDGSCVHPLSKSQPITLDASNGWTAKTGSILSVGGVAMDGVSSVSFTVLGKDVTLAVKHNVYTLKRQSTASTAQCAVAHFADGSTVSAAQVPCPS